jgi:hypothetical protein
VAVDLTAGLEAISCLPDLHHNGLSGREPDSKHRGQVTLEKQFLFDTGAEDGAAPGVDRTEIDPNQSAEHPTMVACE